MQGRVVQVALVVAGGLADGRAERQRVDGARGDCGGAVLAGRGGEASLSPLGSLLSITQHKTTKLYF